ncbi:DsrE/DsrF/DrsH-like family protein [Sulfuricaulis sp.]|jgi:peroxiredoxin family protein|uniref:DsrE/DsrF/DrsH-like family protein n=1 Tax=Sulfuricaulis sp. TaxID=2003553 RepID=UPI00355AAC43
MKKVSVMCFHDELCQVFNALIIALSLLREGSKVTLFFGSRGINVVHRDKMKTLTCLPDEPREIGEAMMAKMDEIGLPLVEDLFVMLIAEGATVLACPLNLPLFGMTPKDLADGVKVADPAKYYKEVVIPADMNLTF